MARISSCCGPGITGGVGRSRGLAHPYFAAGHYGELSVHHDLLACPEAFGNDDLLTLPLPQFYGAHLGGRVLLYNVNERTVGGHLRRGSGNEHSRGNCAENEPDFDETPRPEAAIAVSNRSAQLDGAGLVLHGVVHKRELAE